MAISKTGLRRKIKSTVRNYEQDIDKQLSDGYRESETYPIGVALIPSPREDVEAKLIQKYKKVGWRVAVRKDIHGQQPRTVLDFS
jgi:hypothetical protein